MNFEILEPKEKFKEESYEEMLERYNGFGKNLYLKIKSNIPEVFSSLKFYQRIDFQNEDSYAEYINNNASFAIQLEPLCEVIVLFNHDSTIEIGTWSKDEVEEGLNYIKKEFLNSIT